MDVNITTNSFEWDAGNQDKNMKKHHVSWLECEQVFFNQPVYTLPDEQHSKNEERNFILGYSDAGRLLFISYTIRKNKIRVISARDMSKKERKLYYEKIKADTEV
ncbi:MAG: BrnT family toxin [Ignavibacteriae bacterium]|nr:BrnT family toxin [Ignavibacteriota bacterium]